MLSATEMIEKRKKEQEYARQWLKKFEGLPLGDPDRFQFPADPVLPEVDHLVSILNDEKADQDKWSAAYGMLELAAKNSDQFCAFIGCRMEHWTWRARHAERGAVLLLDLVTHPDEDVFWHKVLFYRLSHPTAEEAFPSMKDDEKLKQAYLQISPQEIAIMRKLDQQTRENAAKELEEAARRFEKEDREKRKGIIRGEKKSYRSDIGFVFLGLLLTVLFGAAALAHYALHTGWEGPQNVFLEVVFPFLMVVATIGLAALAGRLLFMFINPDLTVLGGILGGAAAIAFLIFWKQRYVALGMQIFIAALIAGFLIVAIVKTVAHFRALARIRKGS